MLKMISYVVRKMISDNGEITTETLADLFPDLFGEVLISGPHFAFLDSEKCMDFICDYLNEKNIILPVYDKSVSAAEPKYEMLVSVNNFLGAFDNVLKMAEEDGYITTKTVSDILKPVSISENLIISELTWWSYMELNEKIEGFKMPIAKPGHITISFPKYHTGPTPDNGLSSKEEKFFNAVSHPSHYTTVGRKYEPRKVIADWGLNFNLGNAVKYISRVGRKGDRIEDLQKAIQYIEFELEELDPHYISSANRIMRLKKWLNAFYGVNKEEK